MTSYTLMDIEQLARTHLTPEERGILAEHLAPDQYDRSGALSEDDPDFLDEVERRAAEVLAGTAKTYPLDAVIAELRASNS